MTRTHDDQIPPAFSARLKARNPVLAAADRDGHLFRILYERRERLGWRQWVGSGRLVSTRTLVLLILVPVSCLLIAFLTCIGLALVVGMVVLVKKFMAFQKAAGAFPISVSEIYAEHGCHSAVALDLWMAAVPAREAMEAVYAERFHSARLSCMVGWALMAALLLPIGVLIYSISTLAGAVFSFGALTVMYEASLMLYLVPCQVSRKAIKARNDLWLGRTTVIWTALRALSILSRLLYAGVRLAMFIAASAVLLAGAASMARRQMIGVATMSVLIIAGLWVLVIAMVWAITHLKLRRAAGREMEFLENELGRSTDAHSALMRKMGLIE